MKLKPESFSLNISFPKLVYSIRWFSSIDWINNSILICSKKFNIEFALTIMCKGSRTGSKSLVFLIVKIPCLDHVFSFKLKLIQIFSLGSIFWFELHIGLATSLDSR